ncbi:MAG: hypothetical protein ACI9J3_002859 [Parvicellaceae bacterium]|jgi:hypothetical protein
MRTPLLLIALFLTSISWSQIELKGQVIDPELKAGIEGVRVYLSPQKRSVITDSLGHFTINIYQQPKLVVFSKPGFETVSYTGSEIKYYEFLKVEMVSKVDQLPEVSVNATKILIAYDNPKRWVVDYELLNDRMVILLSRGKGATVVLTDYESNDLDRVEIPKFDFSKGIEHFRNNRSKREFLLNESKNIYKNYNGDIHVVTPDWVNQLIVANDSIFIFPKISYNEFSSKILPIVTTFNGHMYRQDITNHNQKIVYTKLDTNSFVPQRLTIFDKEGADNAQHWWQKSYYASNESSSVMGDINVAQLYDERTKREATGVYRELVSEPEYAPLFTTNEFIYVFDHTNGFIIKCDEDLKIQDKVKIKYHNELKWNEKIHVDMDTKEVYIEFLRKGLKELHKIDLETGKIINVYVLIKQTFPQKIRIKNGFAYYMYKKSADGQKQYLYKQPLTP